MRSKLGAVVLAAAVAMSVAACGDSSSDPAGGDSPAAEKASGPDTADGRKLADWAARKMVTRHTTDICAFGTQELHKRFGAQGWCEKDPTFTQTAVTLDLVGTCDASKVGPPNPAGDLYLYRVEPSIEFDPDRGPQNTVEIVVRKDGEKFLVNAIFAATLPPGDLSTPDCPGNDADPASGSIKLG